MKREVILEGAGPYLTLWRDAFIDSLYKEIPQAIIRPNGNSIIISHRTKVWEIYSSVKFPSDVRVQSIRRLYPNICLSCCLSFILIMVLQVFSWQFLDLFDTYLYETSIWGILLGILITLACGGILLSIHNASVNLNNLGLVALRAWDLLKTRQESENFGSQPSAKESLNEKTMPVPQSASELGDIRYCPVCGAQRVAGAKFCESCGYSF